MNKAGIFLGAIAVIIATQIFAVVDAPQHVAAQAGAGSPTPARSVIATPRPPTSPTNPTDAKPSLTPEQEYLKAAAGGIGSMLGAFLGGLMSWLVYRRGIRTSTRNAFLDMVVGNEKYRRELDSFLESVTEKKPNPLDVESALNTPALIILLLRKPYLRDKFGTAMKNRNMNEIMKLTTQLFTE